jgi:hypothetical protein
MSIVLLVEALGLSASGLRGSSAPRLLGSWTIASHFLYQAWRWRHAFKLRWNRRRFITTSIVRAARDTAALRQTESWIAAAGPQHYEETVVVNWDLVASIAPEEDVSSTCYLRLEPKCGD